MKNLKTCLIISLFAWSCSKSYDGETVPTVSEYTGTLSLGRTKTTTFVPGTPVTVVDAYSESMIAFFPDAYVFSAYVDAGTVKFKDSTLKRGSNGVYICNVTNPNPTSSFVNYIAGGGNWNVSGNSGNLVPAIFLPADAELPSVVGNLYTEPPVVDRTKSFTVNWGTALTNCDSILVTIGGGNSTSVTSKQQPGTNTSYTFPSSELSKLTASPTTGGIASGMIIISGYKFKKTIVSEKKILLLNTSSRSFAAHVQ